MIDKQSLINNPNVQWQSVEDKKLPYSMNNTPTDQLRREATKRIKDLVNSTRFVGYGGAKVNTDGSYEIITNAGSDLVDEKLNEMLSKTFEEDEELNAILDKLKALNAKNTQQTEPKNDQDSFIRSEPLTASEEKWQEQGKYEKDLRDIMYGSLFPTLTPSVNEGGIKLVEDWIKDGGEFPNFPTWDYSVDLGVLAHKNQANKK